MPNLVHRAEEALLGAIIYDPSLIDDVPYLLPRHFDHADHQLIYAAILTISDLEPSTTGALMAERIATETNTPGIDEPRLTGLALSSPDVASAAVYGRMIQEAALRRDLASEADRLEQTARGHGVYGAERDYLQGLARALRAHSGAFTTGPDPAATTTVADTQRQLQHDLHVTREERLLADLIQHPLHINEVSSWLDPDVFTSPDRQAIYQAILNVHQHGEPVEELTVAWQTARSRTSEIATGEQGRRPEALTVPGYVTRLATLPVEAGVSIETGRDLLAEHTRTELASQAAQLAGHPGGGTARARQELHHDPALTRQATTPLMTPPEPEHRLDGPQHRL